MPPTVIARDRPRPVGIPGSHPSSPLLADSFFISSLKSPNARPAIVHRYIFPLSRLALLTLPIDSVDITSSSLYISLWRRRISILPGIRCPRHIKGGHGADRPSEPFFLLAFTRLLVRSLLSLPAQLVHSILVTHDCFLSNTIAIVCSMPFIPPPYPPTRRCPCGVNVSLWFVMATNTCNAGRPYYACSSCRNWYRWGDGLGNSPRNSPTTSPTIDQGKGGCPPAPAPSLPVVGNAESGDHCRSAQCTIKRVGRKCQRCMCHKHCRAAGGCLAEGHSATDSRASATMPNAMPNSNPTLYALPSSSSSIGQPSSALSALSLMSNIDPALRLLSSPPSSIHPSMSSIQQALATPTSLDGIQPPPNPNSHELEDWRCHKQNILIAQGKDLLDKEDHGILGRMAQLASRNTIFKIAATKQLLTAIK
ncbi:hypothetical protein JVT61DRAFT_7169 [Boletus reticuloceps]|uniref:GRF-like zinc ribbon domain-containing protein n=1 Tax=Boletus reticuloceps TaxID=495285 RepID=A0A8I3A786_9AGAM|nr:hypothetical protein JVT61DRAFT_7169 [Boletus reticuloceps]